MLIVINLKGGSKGSGLINLPGRSGTGMTGGKGDENHAA
jgi:hypothetical protein